MREWYSAFRDLSTERHPGGPIPHSKIKQAAAEYGAEAPAFIACMVEMDAVVMAHIRGDARPQDASDIRKIMSRMKEKKNND